jgi:hypothetical protein
VATGPRHYLTVQTEFVSVKGIPPNVSPVNVASVRLFTYSVFDGKNMSLSFWDALAIILASAGTVALVLGIFLWINARLIRREREEFIKRLRD